MELDNFPGGEINETNILLNLINILDDELPPVSPIHPVLLDVLNEEDEPEPRKKRFYHDIIPRFSNNLFTKHFRMNKEVFQELLNVIGTQHTHTSIIPLEKKLLFTLWLLSKPECFKTAGNRFGFSNGTAHYIFKEMTGFLKNLVPQFITWPEKRETSISVFHRKSKGFPGVVGVIGAYHIPIKRPVLNSHDYFNGEEFHSIVLQGICDHRMLFMDINVGMPGGERIAQVFQHSDIFKKLTCTEAPILFYEQHIIGNTEYPLLVNLMTPYNNNGHLNNNQLRYNRKLSCIISTIDKAFGVLMKKFRRLKQLDTCDPIFATDIVTAACVLHNFIILHSERGNVEEEIVVLPDYMIQNNEIDEEYEALQKRTNILNFLSNY